MRVLREAAEKGVASAQDKLGELYYLGECIPQNYSEAHNWYRKAAEQGNADSQCSVGADYYNGRGVPLDYSEAVNWFRKAADQGNELGLSNLGVCYELGRGVRRDYLESMKWYSKAAERGNRIAAMALFRLYLFLPDADGGDVDKALALAESTLRKDAALGHYFRGQILKKTKAITEANAEYLLALDADPNFADAYNQLGYIALEMHRPDVAIGYFVKQVDLAPRSYNAYDSLGDGWAANNRQDEAITSYRKALSLNPSLLSTFRKLGNTLEQAGRLEEASELYRQYADSGVRLGVPEVANDSKIRLDSLRQRKVQPTINQDPK